MLQPARHSLSCRSRACSPAAPRRPRGKPWPGAPCLVGKLRHGWGKPQAGWGRVGTGHGNLMVVLCLEPPGEPLGRCRGQAGGGGGGALPWGSQVPWQGLSARGGPGGHLALLGVAQSPGGPGVVRGLVLGVPANPPPPPPGRGRDPPGQGEPGEEALPAGLHAGYKGGPESPAE